MLCNHHKAFSREKMDNYVLQPVQREVPLGYCLLSWVIAICLKPSCCPMAGRMSRSVLLNKLWGLFFFKVVTKRVAVNFEIFQVLLKPIAIPLLVVVLNRKVIPFLFQMLNMQFSSSSVQNVASGERNVPDGTLKKLCLMVCFM